MILNETQIAAVQQQLNVAPIETDNPAMPQLIEAFGEHTFYADLNGLHVLEALPDDTEGVAPGTAVVIQIAEWTGDDRTNLAPVDPNTSNVLVSLNDPE